MSNRNPNPVTARAAVENGVWIATVVFIGLNLRPFLTGVGPLVKSIQLGTGLDYRGIAWLTLLPFLLMGLGAFFEPALRRFFSARTALLGALALLGAGSALRFVTPNGGMLIVTAILCGIGVAVIQSIFPGILKRRFTSRLAVVTGLYSASLMAGGALGAQITPLIELWSGDWREALAWWAAPAMLALILAWRTLPSDCAHTGDRTPSTALLYRPRTWLLMGCFGLINTGYAALVTWLPPFYQSHGWSSAQSGGLVALMSVAQACAALVLPALSGRRRDRRYWLMLTLGLQAVGFAAFAFCADLAPRLWIVMSGVGLGGSFALMLIIALDHLSNPERAGALTAFMQGGGFLIAAMAPWLIALLHDLTGDFVAGWMTQLGGVILVMLLVTRLAPDGYAAAMAARVPTRKKLKGDT